MDLKVNLLEEVAISHGPSHGKVAKIGNTWPYIDKCLIETCRGG